MTRKQAWEHVYKVQAELHTLMKNGDSNSDEWWRVYERYKTLASYACRPENFTYEPTLHPRKGHPVSVSEASTAPLPVV